MLSHYHAFISYSQRADKRIANALQKGLRQLGAKRYLLRFRALEIFRDETDSGNNKGLKAKIYTGIELSDYLILLANPEVTRPGPDGVNWVDEEIKYWLSTKHKRQYDSFERIDDLKIIICVTGGIIKWVGDDFDWKVTNCLPKDLMKRYTNQPEWVDLREVAKKSLTDSAVLSLEHPDFKQKVAEISARIQGITADELIAEDRLRKSIWQSVLAAVGIALIAISITAVTFYIDSKKNEEEALRQKDAAVEEALANAAYAFADRDPTLSVNYALKALQTRNNVTAQLALVKAFNTGSWFYSHQFDSIYDADISEDGTTVVTTGHSIAKITNLRTGYVKETGVTADYVSYLPDGKILFWSPWHGKEGEGKIVITDSIGNEQAYHSLEFNTISVSNGEILVPAFENQGEMSLNIIEPTTGKIRKERLSKNFDMLYGFYDFYKAKGILVQTDGISSHNLMLRSDDETTRRVHMPDGYQISKGEINKNILALYLLGRRNQPDAVALIDLNKPGPDYRPHMIELRSVDYGDKGGFLTFIDSSQVMAASTDGWVAVVNLKSEKVNFIEGHRATDRMCVSRKGDIVAIAKRSGEVFLHNREGIKLGRLLGLAHSDGLNTATTKIAFDKSGNRAITVNAGTLKVWSKPTYTMVDIRSGPHGYEDATIAMFDSIDQKVGAPSIDFTHSRDSRKVNNVGEVWHQFVLSDKVDFIDTGLTKNDLHTMRIYSEGKTKDWGYSFNGRYHRLLVIAPEIIKALVVDEIAKGRIMSMDLDASLLDPEKQ